MLLNLMQGPSGTPSIEELPGTKAQERRGHEIPFPCSDLEPTSSAPRARFPSAVFPVMTGFRARTPRSDQDHAHFLSGLALHTAPQNFFKKEVECGYSQCQKL